MDVLIHSGDVLLEHGFETRDLAIGGSEILLESPAKGASSAAFDAKGCMILPGIVDIHGDAFERQIMPRPGVSFPLDMALLDTDRQMAANGITTAYLGVTWSWEPGLRGTESARALITTLEAMRDRLAVDTRFHLRHETFNLEAEAEILFWLEEGRIGVLAFNDHMLSLVTAARESTGKIGRQAERCGLGEAEFKALIAQVYARKDEVPASVERLAHAAKAKGVPLLSHDDRDLADRIHYRALGSAIAEFPMQREVAAAARAAGEAVVFGAPNVIRGGSHIGCPSAEAMVREKLCTILASDYYYPALAQAPLRLETGGAAPFADAWALVSTNPAKALGLADRGVIAHGKRADLVIARREPGRLEILATIANGQIAYCNAAHRLQAA
ncbi:COG3454 Metal-dependent hydrolase involved in phosphonate metabolism [Rhabdaerophilaceae bacterium]